MIIKPRTLLALSILTAFNVHSAGFQVAEHSASGLGRAFSGEGAVADNASVIAHNPAAMTRFDTTQFSGALSIVDPEVDVYDVKNQQKMNDVAPLQVVPAAYYVSPINEQWAWGMGIFTTYGVATDYPNDIYAGDLAGDTSLLSVNLNPNIAYRVNEQLSLAAGINLVYAEAKLTRHKGALAVFTGGSASDNLVGMTGETMALGWNIGSLYEFNQNHRVGFAYRSAVDLDFDDGEFSSYSSGVATNAVVEGRLKITLPAMWEVSAFHQLTDSVALHYGYQRTDWSSFKELKATSSQCTNGECFYKSEKYEDSGRWSLGSTYQLNSTWTLRAGFAFDEQAGEATLSIPDSDRYWYSAGVSYVISDSLSIDAGFALVKSKSGTFTETNKLNETLTFESQGTAYLSAIQLNYTFN
ncbi:MULTISPECIES: outer membrane protein transport protein [unclassified Vibrio]|uniref:outer membrane protein transport protein n=1 Tax=unclassified Vibrio TaxID=2614977 RepID=UPI0014825804|nr:MULTISPECIES: outer membrane protein transport protein [unclassified Vibrio]MDQ2190741.1 outer membrane protein transport protein [Vibrio sp. A14(2019)]MDQ2196950.1 outer membrane protein transport protein [Vibrio sp. 2017_1457_11]NNN75207.1 outer membrane protein transport protein [Vibrio sp. B7]NNN92218.1 outer membrane protein transport protein [Vibrio sp. B8-1]NNO07518.1 outer membrane protein transport protein [Vibrio sp. B4-12]